MSKGQFSKKGQLARTRWGWVTSGGPKRANRFLCRADLGEISGKPAALFLSLVDDFSDFRYARSARGRKGTPQVAGDQEFAALRWNADLSGDRSAFADLASAFHSIRMGKGEAGRGTARVKCRDGPGRLTVGLHSEGSGEDIVRSAGATHLGEDGRDRPQIDQQDRKRESQRCESAGIIERRRRHRRG